MKKESKSKEKGKQSERIINKKQFHALLEKASKPIKKSEKGKS